jgi:hypothetical protein
MVLFCVNFSIPIKTGTPEHNGTTGYEVPVLFSKGQTMRSNN